MSDATQGAWRVIANGPGEFVVRIDAQVGKFQSLADAQTLCARLNNQEGVRGAAVELLAACKANLEWLEKRRKEAMPGAGVCECEECELRRMTRGVINKAEERA